MIVVLDNIGASTIRVIMNNRNEFQKLARKFRSGGISLNEFVESVFSDSHQSLHINDGATDFCLPVRPANSHKGDFGRLLFIGGSETMPGAIALAAMASLKSGAGTGDGDDASGGQKRSCDIFALFDDDWVVSRGMGTSAIPALR